MAWKDCDECQGTGFIEVESVVWSRSYYSKEHKEVVRDFYGKGDWHKAVCPCVGEEEYLAKEAACSKN